MKTLFKLYIILFILFAKSNSGPVAAYTACTVCCGAIHSWSWFVPIVGASFTGACIVDACLSPIPGMCVDPRNNACVLAYLGALVLPTP